jgi:hypothetical protein
MIPSVLETWKQNANYLMRAAADKKNQKKFAHYLKRIALGTYVGGNILAGGVQFLVTDQVLQTPLKNRADDSAIAVSTEPNGHLDIVKGAIYFATRPGEWGGRNLAHLVAGS